MQLTEIKRGGLKGRHNHVIVGSDGETAQATTHFTHRLALTVHRSSPARGEIFQLRPETNPGRHLAARLLWCFI